MWLVTRCTWEAETSRCRALTALPAGKLKEAEPERKAGGDP